MNDREQIDELEPLDPSSMGLLAAYRRRQGPSEDATARMLAGLRARVEADATDEAHEDAVAPAVEPDAPPRTSARTVVVAAVAFAAGVGLTLALAQRPAPGSGGDDVQVATRSAARPSRPATEADAAAHGNPAHLGSPPAAVSIADIEAERPWPLSLADLASPQEEEAEADAEPGREEATPTEPSATTTRSSGVTTPENEPTSTPGAAAGPTAPRAADPPRRRSSPKAWAPALTPTPRGPSFGPSTHSQAPGGPSHAGGPARGGGSKGGAPATDPAGDPPPGDSEPKGPPPEGPDPGSDPDPEPDSDERPEEPPIEERCDTELQTCTDDAEAYCGWNPDGCAYVHEFCHERMEACMNDEPMAPYPEPPQPDEPMPYDCFDDYEMCMMETDAICVFDKAAPEACEDMYWQCEDMLTACESEPPPMPPMPPG